MSIDLLQTVDIIEIMENYIENTRPPEEMRPQLDISYKIDGQSIIIFEIRPRCDNTAEFMECCVAKTTFIKTQKVWKIFWMRANSKWYSFEPHPAVKTLHEFVQIVDADKYGCFWG